jgi:hypothetical protein
MSDYYSALDDLIAMGAADALRADGYDLPAIDDTEELDPRLYETLPLELPTLDQQIEDVIAFGTRLDAMDAKGTDDDAG